MPTPWEATPSARTGRPLSAASVARKLSALAELYRYAIELGVLEDNPVDNVKRPKVADESQTVGLTPRSCSASSTPPKPTPPG